MVVTTVTSVVPYSYASDSIPNNFKSRFSASSSCSPRICISYKRPSMALSDFGTSVLDQFEELWSSNQKVMVAATFRMSLSQVLEYRPLWYRSMFSFACISHPRHVLLLLSLVELSIPQRIVMIQWFFLIFPIHCTGSF